jgi:type I restriction enzyme, S subunit
MKQVQQLLTEHLDIWTAAETEKKSGRGRAGGGAGKVYGIQKLRSLILDLAMRGKLVPQDPGDEPASELLKNIQAQKAKLIAEGKLKKEKRLAPIANDEKLFDLPKGWEWVRLGVSGKIFNGNSINEQEKESKFTNLREGFPFIATKDVGYGRESLDYDNGVLIPFDNDTFKVAHKSAILICSEGGSAGRKIGLTNTDICFGNKLYANETWDGINPRFIFYLYQSPLFFKSFSNRMTGIIGGISINEFLSIPIPIPSSHEQDRISSKLDELMVLCDQLEEEHSNATEAHEKLVENLLGTLTRTQNAQEFNSQWQRIYAHFDTLFTTETSIDGLKQTLLQLAVMGKLVPQDPNDEPASQLLKRIQAETAKLIAEGKLKKEKPLAPINNDEKPFQLPKGWEWVKFGALVLLINGDRGKNYPNQSEYVKSGVAWINTGHIQPDGTLSRTEMNFITKEKFNELRSGKIKEGDLVYCLRGATFGKTAFVKPYSTGAVASSLVVIRPKNLKLVEYIYKYLISPFGKSQVYRFDNGSAQPNLSANSLTLYAFPLPPIAEQQRILAKLDELMALCDELKRHIQEASHQQQQLADVLVLAATSQV